MHFSLCVAASSNGACGGEGTNLATGARTGTNIAIGPSKLGFRGGDKPPSGGLGFDTSIQSPPGKFFDKHESDHSKKGVYIIFYNSLKIQT